VSYNYSCVPIVPRNSALLSGLPDYSWYNVPKRENISKWPTDISNGHKIYKHFPLQDPPKVTQIKIFGLKIYHLATLLTLAASICRPDQPVNLSFSSSDRFVFRQHFLSTSVFFLRLFFKLKCVSLSCRPVPASAAAAGWPDWANFRLLDDCLLWVGFFYLLKRPKLFGYVFPG
jgi:hypothetical protein